MTHVRIWRFQPAAGHERDFAAAYSGDGIWAKLFEQAQGFVSTSLLAPEEPGGPWLTVDRWQSRAAFDRFQQVHGEAYRALDVELEPLTVDELFIGTFEE
jgi:heme-degrading monooxygenase HmoA